jgi:two-component system, OmpR family, response regulator CpxR
MSVWRSSLHCSDFPRAITALDGVAVLEEHTGGPQYATPAVEGVVQRFARTHALSSRETGVLTLSAVGLHRKEVAFRLGCSAGTVDTYWRRIFKKTATASQCEVLAALLSLAAADKAITDVAEAAEQAAAAVPDSAVGLPPAPRCDVLVVEDDDLIREELAESLRECGFRVATAANGRDALGLLVEAPVGVVVLDLVMPVMDGWQLALSISSIPHLTRTPLLFMTAASPSRRPLPGPVFIKPFDFASLARSVRLYLASANATEAAVPTSPRLR